MAFDFDDDVTELCLIGAGLSEVPPRVFELPKLRSLDLSGNQLKTLPEIPAGALQKLVALSLADNPLEALPRGIGGLTSLQTLDVSRTLLSVLPAEIGGCARLARLEAERCQLEELPPEMGRLKNLGYLMLDGNRLSTVPAELAAIPHLDLWLRDNRLTSLPEPLRQRLTDVRVEGNFALPAAAVRRVYEHQPCPRCQKQTLHASSTDVLEGSPSTPASDTFVVHSLHCDSCGHSFTKYV
jgi:Leucine-rich repeat (LRR) protein